MSYIMCGKCGEALKPTRSDPFDTGHICGTTKPSNDNAAPETIQLPTDGLPLDCISYRCACGTDVFGAELVRIVNGKPQRVCMTCVMKP